MTLLQIQPQQQPPPVSSSPQLEVAYRPFPPALVGGAPLPLASPQQFFTAPAAAPPVTQLPTVRLPLAPPPPGGNSSSSSRGSGSSGHNGQPQPLLAPLPSQQPNAAPSGMMVNVLQQTLPFPVVAEGQQQLHQQQVGQHQQQQREALLPFHHQGQQLPASYAPQPAYHHTLVVSPAHLQVPSQ
jgi:hypothetical protein